MYVCISASNVGYAIFVLWDAQLIPLPCDRAFYVKDGNAVFTGVTNMLLPLQLSRKNEN